MEQRSKEWREARRGRFTSSPAHRLLTDGSRPMTKEELIEWKKENPKSQKKTTACTGESLYSYAFEKACEIVYGVNEEEQYLSFDVQTGKELEPLAFERFKASKALEFIDVQKVGFVPYGDNSGSSPDGLVNDDELVEVKCPKSATFFRIVADGIDAIKKEYIDQMQHQMMCTKRKGCYFYVYIVYNGLEMSHELYIPRDDARIALIESRTLEAVKIRDEYVELLKKNRQA